VLTKKKKAAFTVLFFRCCTPNRVTDGKANSFDDFGGPLPKKNLLFNFFPAVGCGFFDLSL
jgi:hypothetical protein